MEVRLDGLFMDNPVGMASARQERVSLRIGGTMKAWIRIAMLVTLTVCGTIASSAQEPKPAMD